MSDIRYPVSPSMIEQVSIFNAIRSMALTEREIMLGLSYPPCELERWLMDERDSESHAIDSWNRGG